MRVWLYYRLSRDEDDELNSLTNQRKIKELVRGSVEETLNELLEQEAESLTQAARYERSVQQRHG